VVFWSFDVPEDDGVPKPFADRISAFAHTTAHFFGLTRWNRVFRLVH
jgi:hypothetical protein